MSDDAREIHARIERAINSAHSGLLDLLPRALKRLRRKKEAFPDDHLSARKTIAWNVIKHLSSLARARMNGRMTQAQIGAHDEILQEVVPLLPALDRFGFNIPPVVLAGISEQPPVEQGKLRTYFVYQVRTIDSRERIGEISAESALKAFGELAKHEQAAREKGGDGWMIVTLSSPTLEARRSARFPFSLRP